MSESRAAGCEVSFLVVPSGMYCHIPSNDYGNPALNLANIFLHISQRAEVSS
jgi:hypothetical protein